MASFIPNITDTIPDLPSYTPNFGFFAQMMQRKASQYESGYSQVKSAYDSILNAPLSNDSNIQVRDQYLKQAQDQLKNLSSVDLSMQQNVDAANNVFAPFWQDDKLLKDASLTKFAQSEIQKGMMLRDSKNKEDRDQYSDVAMQYISNGLEKMKNLNREDNAAWNNLEKRRFTPFVNKDDYWRKAAKDAGFEINTTDASGPYLVSTKNGEKSLMSWKTFAEANTTQQMRDMDRVRGVVENEQSIKNVKTTHPGISDQEAQQLVAQDYLIDMRKHAQDGLDNINTEITSTKAKLDQFKTLSTITPAQKNRMIELNDYMDSLTGIQAQKQKIYDSVRTDTSQGAVDLVNQITSHPDYYFANLAHQRDVNNWAAGQAANTNKEVKFNQAWAEADKVAYQREELKFKQAEMAWKMDQDQYDRSHSKRYYRDGDQTDENGNALPGSGSGSGGNQNIRELTHGILQGQGTTDITRTGNALDALNERQSFRLNTARNSVFDYDGLGRTLEGLTDGKGKSVSQSDVVNYLSAARRGDTNLTAEERASKGLIDQALKLKTGITITDEPSLRNAIMKQAESYFTDKNHNGSPDWTHDDVQSLIKYRDGISALNEYTGIESKRQELIKKELSTTSDPALRKLTVTRPNGQKDIVNGNDVGQAIGNLKIVDVHGKIVPVSNKEIGDAFLNGQFNTSTGSTSNPYGGSNTYAYYVNIGPRQVEVSKDMYYHIHDLSRGLDAKYGHPDTFQKTILGLNQRVVPNVGEYNNETGKMGQVIDYPLNSKEGKQGLSTGNKLINEASLASNREGIYIDGQLSKEDENKGIIALMSLGQGAINDYISGVKYNQNGLNGKPTLDLVFNPISSNDKKTINGVNVASLAGKTVQIQLSPNAQGPTINSIPKNNGIYIYDAVLRGKSVEADPIMKAGNFDYKIQPDDTRNPRQVYVTINNKVFNKNTAQYEDHVSKQTFDLYGPKAKTPDELVSFINNMFETHLNNNKLNQQLYKSSLPPEATQTYDDIINELKQRKVGQ